MGSNADSSRSLSTRIIGSLWGALTVIVAGPILLWGALWWLRARETDDALEIISRIRGVTARHPWAHIASMKMVGCGPMIVPKIQLRNGRTILLKRDSWRALAPVLAAHSIPVHNLWALPDDPWALPEHDG
jgi:hypothetical protein